MIIIMSLGLSSCGSKGESYYRSNPQAMQQAIKDCPGKQPEGISCAQLKVLARRLDSLAYQLQLSPQGFGNKILAIQETIAKQKLEVSTKPDLKSSIEEKEKELADHMTIVTWFESPES